MRVVQKMGEPIATAALRLIAFLCTEPKQNTLKTKRKILTSQAFASYQAIL
jgi:hypothetical protein